MKALVLGSGGREHALAWRLAKSPSCSHIFLHPGNAGTHRDGLPFFEGVPDDDPQAIADRAREEQISLVVIGPEVLLEKGWADVFRKEGFSVVGPSSDGARLETSKIFAKEFMTRAGIPTAPYFIVDSFDSCIAAVESQNNYPTVLKLDGLAAGKGVCVAQNEQDARDFADRVWNQNAFGPGPHRLLIEEFLPGREISYIVVTDGKTFVPMASATDYKRVGDGNTGPNTGGMGCVSPSPFITPELESKIATLVVEPALAQLRKEAIPYRGVLYCGLMVENGEPSVVEFNARFGDPETQVTLLRLQSDFGMLLLAAGDGQLAAYGAAHWTPDPAIYVVGAAQGYPDSPRKGDAISGWESLDPGTKIFYSGVTESEGRLLTSGGRVLGVGLLAPNFEQARRKVYSNLSRLHWEGMHYRKDIGS